MADKDKGSFFRWLSKPESMVGLSAVLISIVAVGVSAYEASLIRSSQHAAAWPNIQLNRSMFYSDGENGERIWTLTFNAENVGVGPALIKDFKVTVDGEAYPTWGAAIKTPDEDADGLAYGRELYDAMDSLDFKACYCSISGDCWTASYQAEQSATPVKTCKPSEDSFTE